MSQFKIPLLISSIVFLVAILFVFLVRSNRLPNPFQEIEPENAALSTAVGAVNNLLGHTNENRPEDENESKSLKEQFANSSYPAELFDFDVTQQKAVFGIVSSNPDKKTMILRFAFPFVRRDKVIEASISCSIKNSTIITFDPLTQATEISEAQKPLYELAVPGADSLQGVCADNECSSIVGECELARTK